MTSISRKKRKRRRHDLHSKSCPHHPACGGFAGAVVATTVTESPNAFGVSDVSD
jgi:hypothetical protein